MHNYTADITPENGTDAEAEEEPGEYYAYNVAEYLADMAVRAERQVRRAAEIAHYQTTIAELFRKSARPGKR